MKRFWPVATLVALGALLSVSHAKEKPVYQTARLVDLRAYPTGGGAFRAQYSFCLAFQVEDVSYMVEYWAFSRGSYQPTNLIVGDPVEIRTKGDDLYFRAGKKPEDESKAHITRRERVTPDSKPATCALPVAVDH
jgi:hypothetical protein